MLCFVKSYSKFLLSKLNLLISVTISGLLFALFTGSLNRGYEKASALILKKSNLKKLEKFLGTQKQPPEML